MKLSASKQSILSHVESQFYAKKMSYTLTSNKGKLSASETERLTDMDLFNNDRNHKYFYVSSEQNYQS